MRPSMAFALFAFAHASVSSAGLSKQEADAAVREAWTARQARIPEASSVAADLRVMRWEERTTGEKPPGGYSLWISLHGGGSAPAAVNDAQARDQLRIYPPFDGIWVAPRAPTDAWNMWHEPHMDALLDQLIALFVARRGVDPDRVYLLGYSAGGDGVYQLAPRMADRFAAASMMAGHPNDARPDGLRNLPFAIFVGGADSGFDRNKVAAEWGRRLDALREADPSGYVHRVTLYEGLGHWMNGRDAEALPWMAAFRRDPWPKRVVWCQDDVTHDRFYWLSVPPGTARAGQKIEAAVEGQTIKLVPGDVRELTLWLSDRLVDLDRPIKVIVGDKTVFEGTVPRARDAIAASLAARPDPSSAATASLPLKLR